MSTETEPRPETVEEDQNQHLGESQVEGGAPDPIQPTPTVELRQETWLHEDVRKLVRAAEMVAKRGVNVALICRGCNGMLQLVGRDNGGASLMACGCTVRRWL